MNKYPIKKVKKDFEFLDITINIKGSVPKKWQLIIKEIKQFLNIRV